MHNSIEKLIQIEKLVKSKKESLNLLKQPRIIAVSKTFKLEKILPLIEHGHLDYGENKVQEAIDKWTKVKKDNSSIKLHLIGRLQSNKVKFAVKLFDYIHSLDSKKLADKISKQQKELDKETKLFIQVNIGNEDQKSGINEDYLEEFYDYCKSLNLNIIGLMCIPPFNEDSSKYFKRMKYLKNKMGLKEISMGMSSDYLDAIENGSTFIRIGSDIFGQRN